MAFGTPVVGTTAYSASAGTSVAPRYPSGVTATDQLVLIIGQKPSAANSGSVTTPSGWTLRESLSGAGGYGATLGADTGNTNLRIYTKNTVTGSESGTLSVTVGTNGVCWANITRVPTGGGAISYGSADGQITTTPTSPLSVQLLDAAETTAFAAGDFAIWAMCIPTDVTTPAQFSAHTITAAGVTYNATAELVEPDSTTGNDIGGFVAYSSVASGSSSGLPTVGATLAGTLTNVRGPIVLLRIREAPVYNLTGNSSRTDHASTAGGATQQHQMAGNDVAQATTSTTGAVESQAPAITLAGNNVAQQTRSTVGAVTQTVGLTGANARQNTTTTAGAVAQTAILAGTGAAQPATSGTGAVEQTHQLAGTNAAQAAVTTADAVSQAHILVGAAARQNAEAVAGGIVQTHILVGAGAALSHAASSAPVVQTHFLAGEACAVAHSAIAGAVDLTFAQTLTGADAAQPVAGTVGAVVQVHVLAGAAAAAGHTATADEVTTDNTVTLAGAQANQATTSSAGAVQQVHALGAQAAATGHTSTAAAVASGALPVNLAGAIALQPTAATDGPVGQVHVLWAAPVAVDAVAQASAVVQMHLLVGADAVAHHAATAGSLTVGTPDVFSGAGRVRLGGLVLSRPVPEATPAVVQAPRMAAGPLPRLGTAELARAGRLGQPVVAAAAPWALPLAAAPAQRIGVEKL